MIISPLILIYIYYSIYLLTYQKLYNIFSIQTIVVLALASKRIWFLMHQTSLINHPVHPLLNIKNIPMLTYNNLFELKSYILLCFLIYII